MTTSSGVNVPSTARRSQLGDFLPWARVKVKGWEKGALSASWAFMSTGWGFVTQMKAWFSVSLGTLSFTSNNLTDNTRSADIPGFSVERNQDVKNLL